MPEIQQPEIAVGVAQPAKGDVDVALLVRLIVFAAVVFLLGAGQWPFLLMLIQQPVVHPLVVSVCFVMLAVLLAWRLGLWRTPWFARISVALICVVVTSWPVIGYVLVLACYNGPCRFS